jgi:hypothetical protein
MKTNEMKVLTVGGAPREPDFVTYDFHKNSS